MTKPLGSETGLEDAQAEKQARLRKFALPFLYGLASANFIALIQFVSAEQLKVDWRLKLTAQSSHIIGLFGMILMSISIPALIMYAIYLEVVAQRKRNTGKLSIEPLASIFTLGIVGIAFTLAAFQPVVGIVLFMVTAASAEWVAKSISRSN